MAAAFDDQPQLIVTGKVDRGRNILRRLGRHSIDARLRGPSVDPPRGLGQIDLVANEVRVFEFAEQIVARGPLRHIATDIERWRHLDQSAADISVEPRPASAVGPVRVGGTHPPKWLVRRRRRGPDYPWQYRYCRSCRGTFQQTSSVHRPAFGL